MSHKTNTGRIKPCASKENEADAPPRRLVLRGALATGCCLLMPLALSGCGADKETELADGMAPMADPASAGLPGAQQAKVSQASVQYQPRPRDGQACAGCMHFIIESNTCKKVEGDIGPAGWCVLWEKAELSSGNPCIGRPAAKLA